MKINFKYILLLLSLIIVIIFLPRQSFSQFNDQEICLTVKQSTVKIFNSNGWGSGIIISKEASSKPSYSTYTLITNDHVLDEKVSFVTIQSPSQQFYQASVLVRYFHTPDAGYDLAALQFESQESYNVLSMKEWDGQSEIISTGIPLFSDPELSDEDGFLCSGFIGISRYLDKEMMGGYQMGYSFGVRQGMSGGGIYDHFGHLVGINGKGRSVIAPAESYLYRDGTPVQQDLALSMPLETAQIILRESSWGISTRPIAYLLPLGLGLDKLDSKD